MSTLASGEVNCDFSVKKTLVSDGDFHMKIGGIEYEKALCYPN
ncbi:hypothetical protein [Lelliottia sp. CFBP8978]|nr:hypothetical protein [Lelliottia sp. CFBP8978]MDY1035573.1 hypothetical protein [Lelliottia sp. CFBP8978]